MLERWFPPHTTWYNLHMTGNLLTRVIVTSFQYISNRCACSMPLWFFVYVVSRLVHFFRGSYPKISYSSIFNLAHLQSTIQYFKEVSPAVGWFNLLYQWKLIRRTSFCIDCRETSTDVSVGEAMCPQHNAWTDSMWAVQLPLCAWRGPPESVPSSSWWSLSLSLIGGFGGI